MRARACVAVCVCACCSCCLLRLGRSAPSPCCRVLAKEVGVARHLRYCFIITVRRIISATQPRAKTLQIRCTHRQINLPGAPPPLVRPVVIYAIAASSRRTSNGRNFFHEGSPPASLRPSARTHRLRQGLKHQRTTPPKSVAWHQACASKSYRDCKRVVSAMRVWKA